MTPKQQDERSRMEVTDAMVEAACVASWSEWKVRNDNKEMEYLRWVMRAALEAALSAHLEAQGDVAKDTNPGSVPPRWYTLQEIEHCLKRMNYSEVVIAELAPWFFRHIKLAFDKGYLKAMAGGALALKAEATGKNPVDAVWKALEKVSCPGVYMKIAAEAVAAAITTDAEAKP